MQQSSFIDKFEIQIRDLLEKSRTEFSPLEPARLHHRPSPERWTAQECFAHLNSFMEIYFPQVEKAIHKAKARQWQPADEVKYSWAGRRAIRRVSAIEHPNPRRAKKKHDFHSRTGRRDEFKSFLINLEILLRLLRQSRAVDLNRTKVKMSGSWFFSFKLGELYEYLVTHAERHLPQALAAT